MARRLLVQSFLREGKPDKALEAMKPRLDVAQDSDMLALAGEVYVQNGNTAEAAQYFEKAAGLDPKNPRSTAAKSRSRICRRASSAG